MKGNQMNINIDPILENQLLIMEILLESKLRLNVDLNSKLIRQINKTRIQLRN